MASLVEAHVIRSSAAAVFVFGLGLGISAPALAQAQGPMRTIEVGGVAGINSFTLAGLGDTTAHSRTAFYAGVAAQFPLPGGWFVEPQAIYTGKGVSTRSMYLIWPVDNVIRLDYVAFPVLVGRRFGGRLQERLYAGPELEFNLNCEIGSTIVGNPNVPMTSTCTEVGLVMHRIDLGVTGGGGVAFAFGRGTLSLEARFTAGVTSISSVKTVRNQGFGVGVGYTISPSRF